jgi:hypothetical protein
MPVVQWETVKNETVMRLIVRRPPKCLIKLMQERAKNQIFRTLKETYRNCLTNLDRAMHSVDG